MSKKKNLIWILPIFWLGLIIFLTFQNGDSSEKLSHIIAEKICAIFDSPKDIYDCEVALRDLAHISIHFVLAFLTALAAYYKTENPFYPGITSVIVCAIIAVLDEVGQLFIASRSFEYIDIIRNLLGVTYGTMCFIFVNSIKKYLETARK
ncbi:VanZ family protein [Candidatus Saccharibacteria bacterium]|nr:VanZ family protein [Candidatus Saccharibacteria bacterium]MBR3378482.1 VanZ family protein [Candidatus Saccharibacteria bacterium]